MNNMTTPKHEGKWITLKNGTQEFRFDKKIPKIKIREERKDSEGKKNYGQNK